MSNDDLKSLEARYEIITELGRGGTSIVYKARDKTLDRMVALKTLSAQSLSEKQLVQFQAEAKALSNLKHKCIMEILDFGTTSNGIPYMVLEYINGVPLSKQIENLGPLPLMMTLAIFHDLCEALNHAHNKGVLHRDIKPSNIILVSQDSGYTPKIIDFGLAVLSHKEEAESSHAAAGSPPYMSPEQIDGKETDQRSDIYSLGCTLFESLTGKVPYSGNTAFETMNMHKSAPVPSLSKVTLENEIQTGLQNCLNKALAKNKNDRYQFVIAMQKALDEILDQATEIARIKAQSKTESSQSSRKGTSLKIFYAVALVVALGSSVYYVSSLKKTEKDESNFAQSVKWLNREEKENKESMSLSKKFAAKVTGSQRNKLIDVDKLHPNVREIGWDAVDLKDFDFTRLKRFERLESLHLRKCDISPAQFSQICQLKTLKALQIAWDETVKNSDFSQLNNLPNLVTLGLACNNIDKKGILAASKLKNLQVLNIQKNDGVDGDVIKILAKLPHLRKLKIGTNAGIQGDTILLLGELKNLDELYMDMLNLDDLSAAYLASKLNKLQILSVGHTSITIKGLRALCRIGTLKEINISGCKNLQDDASLDAIDFLASTNKHLVISSQSEIIKD
ncbi:MAG: protein kinase [Cyanobacteria bacterium TGS_CYA1]|nr:protein kinase [Cyanobacteria bacterium TGS_CYA1]